MNKVLIIIVVILVGAGVYWKFGMPKTNNPVAEAPGSAQTTVELKDFAFNPKTITVKAGSSIKFINQDLAGHSVTPGDKTGDDSGILNQGESTMVTF